MIIVAAMRASLQRSVSNAEFYRAPISIQRNSP